jgi:hypothetical protein
MVLALGGTLEFMPTVRILLELGCVAKVEQLLSTVRLQKVRRVLAEPVNCGIWHNRRWKDHRSHGRHNLEFVDAPDWFHVRAKAGNGERVRRIAAVDQTFVSIDAYCMLPIGHVVFEAVKVVFVEYSVNVKFAVAALEYIGESAICILVLCPRELDEPFLFLVFQNEQNAVLVVMVSFNADVIAFEHLLPLLDSPLLEDGINGCIQLLRPLHAAR